jgi:hemin uptake protein HemP
LDNLASVAVNTSLISDADNTDDLGSLAKAWNNTYSNKVFTTVVSPHADSTTALQINKADGTTNVLNVDTTNSRVGIGTNAPGASFEVGTASGAWGANLRFTRPASSATIDTRFAAATDGLIIRNFDSAATMMFSFRDYNDVHIWDMTAGGRSLFNGATDNTTSSVQIGGSDSLAVAGKATIQGNVGIGTTSPTAALHLKAGTATASTAPLKFTSSAGALLGTTEAGAIEFDGTHLYFTAADAGSRYQLDQQASGSQTPWASAINAAGYTLNGNSTASGNLTLDSTSDATKGYVLLNPTSGNVGIGTTGPGYLLSLGAVSKGFSEYNSGGAVDAIKAVGSNSGANFGTQNLNAAGYSGIEYIDNAGSVAVFTGYRNGGSGEFRFNNVATSGYINFMIGSASKLVINNDGSVKQYSGAGLNSIFYVDADTANNSNVSFYNNNSAQWYLRNTGNGANRFGIFASNGTSELLSVMQTGNVGIGTTVPNAKLEVSGQFFSTLYAGSVTINWDNGNVQSFTLASGANTVSFSNAKAGAEYILRITQSGAGGGTISWSGNWKWPGGVTPVLTSTSSALDIFKFTSNGTNVENIGFAADIK